MLSTFASPVKGPRSLAKGRSKSATGKAKRFRLLIIGKTGCGKTTILSKVCGEDVVDIPSTSRGKHDIEREIIFQRNDKLVAHDSEGFEVGQSDEVDVVKNFINHRSKAKDINDRLHMIWYCVEMNSRPIQYAEREFFNILWQVPVLVIVTKFDVFVQDVLQPLEGAAEEEGKEINDEELEAEAMRMAKVMFDIHVKAPLMALPCPPRTVLTLHQTHESTSNDSGLAELIQKTMDALKDEEEKDNARFQLRMLFATAQTVDVRTKLEVSTHVGIVGEKILFLTPELNVMSFCLSLSANYGESPSSINRHGLLVTILSYHINDGPRMIGHPASEDYWEVMEWRRNHLQSCQREQIVAETVLIMEKVFLLEIKDVGMLENLLKWYTQRSITPTYVRDQLMKEHRLRKGGSVGMDIPRLCAIVRGRPLEGSIY